METIDRLPNLYFPETERIQAGEKTFQSAHEKLQIARLYIEEKKLEPMFQYLDLCKFDFLSDVLGDRDYIERYFENLVDVEKRQNRKHLEEKIIDNLSKLAK